MITIKSKDASRFNKNLEGMYVFKSGDYFYEALVEGRYVESDNEENLVVRKLAHEKQGDKFVYTEVDGDEQPEVWKKAKVTAVCDTIDELNLVTEVTRDNRRRFTQLVENSRVAINELHGISVSPSPEVSTTVSPWNIK